MATDEGVLPTGTVTFLFTDVEGSTAAWQQASDRMPETIAHHDAILARAIAAHGGFRPVDQGEGDSVVAAFARPSDAIAAALDAQRALKAARWPEGPELLVRMGVHTGEVVQRGEGNYAGVTLNRCARLRDAGHGGQVLVSTPTAELVYDRLPAGASLIDLGSHHLKDLIRAERVWQLAHLDLAMVFPPLRTLDAYRHNLPSQVTPLIGRQPELQMIGAALEGDRLVTLIGSAGVGKTRLAVHAAADGVDRYPGGVWFVDLATVTDPSAVGSKVASVLRVLERTGEPTVEALARFIADRQALLLLDNCEHVLEACSVIVEGLLAGCPHLSVLTTSREPLAVLGEVTVPVPSLSTPPPGWRADAVALSSFDAVRLFGDRARRVRPGFALTDDNAGAVADVCTRLDGIPLALELAAARCRSLTPVQISQELDRRFRLLTGGARTALPRQQTLLASITWSHELLTDEEKVVFRRLGVFSGPFPLEAAEAVCAGDGVSDWSVFEIVTRLVDKSLVGHDEGTGWYRLLETLRLYALDHAAGANELKELRDSHAAWWSRWLTALGPDAPSDSDVDAIALAYPNLRAALEWSASSEPKLALDIAAGLGIYWQLSGVLGDAMALGDLALTAGREVDPTAWARTVGLIGSARRSAGDAAFFTDIVPEAYRIAQAGEDCLTPLRCRAAELATIDDPFVIEHLADAAELAGDRWVGGRLRFLLAVYGRAVIDVDIPANLAKVAASARALDASSFWIAYHSGAAQDAAPQDLAAAIVAAERALPLLERGSPTTVLHLLATMAWFGRLRGDLAVLERVAKIARLLTPDWGVLTVLAQLLEQLPDLVRNGERWAGPAIPVMPAMTRSRWMLIDVAGDAGLVPMWRAASDENAGEISRMLALIDAAQSDFAAGRFREAEISAAALVRRPAEDRHYWLLMLARCAAEAGTFVEASRLLGAVAGAQDRLEAPWLPRVLLAERDVAEQRARENLGDEAFTAAYDEGWTLDADDAIAYAVRARGERKRPSSGWDSLTPTEQQVIKHVAAGRSNAQIAAELLMSRATVKTHLAHIFAKLSFSNRAEVAAEATRRASLAAS